MRIRLRAIAALQRLGTAVALCALGACAAPPLPKRAAGIEPPATWSAGASAAEPTSLADWWQHFGDPLLSELEARALAANTDVRGAQTRLRQARAARELALAGLRPGLSLTGSSQRNEPSDGGSSRLVQSALEASWDLDLSGAARRGADATAADLLASEATLGATRTAVAAEVAIAYVQLRGSQARLAIARDNLRAQQEILEITGWRAQAGLTSSLDVEQATAGAAQTQAQLPPLEAAIAQAGHALSVLTGEPPLALRERLAEAGPIPEPPAELTLAIPVRTLRQRPDVHAAELAVDAAALRVAQTGASDLPSFVLRGSLAWSAMSLGSLGGPAARALIGSTSLPLLDGGARRARVQSQQAQFDAAQAAFDASVLAALQEVEDVLAGLNASRDRLAALREAAGAAASAALLASHRYASGITDFQTVLETQRSRLSVQDGVATTQAELAAGHVRLYKALGGGWTPSAASDTKAGRS
jgi:NodT family efflux transporter outer membrane factor (OMF) lipoprotein